MRDPKFNSFYKRPGKSTAFLSFFLFVWVSTAAQVAWLEPADPSPEDLVTLTYNSNEGNKGLSGYEGTVYLHTGAITAKSIDGGDWKHVIGNWGEADERVIMKSIGGGLHQFSFVINELYGLRSEEVVQQLAFVFRDEAGGRVGKTAANEDIFLAVNGYKPPIKKEATYNYSHRKYLSHYYNDTCLSILTDNGLTQISSYTPSIIEVKHFKTSVPRADSSHAIVMKPHQQFIRIQDDTDYIWYVTDSLKAGFHKNPFYGVFVYHGDTLLQEEKGFFERSDNDGLRFHMDDNERFYGLGERSNAFDLKGFRYNLYNRPKYGYEIGARNLNYSIPLVVSSQKYMLFFDNPQKGYADLGETEASIMEWGSIGGLMKYVFIAAPDFKGIASQYAKLTGHQPLPPRWALGNLQSRMAYRSQKETDSIVGLMQKKDFPLDAIILDFYWFGDSILGTLGRLKWYTPNWPKPYKMINDFKSKGVKTILITEPYILDSLDNFRITDSLGILAKDDQGNSHINYGFYFGNGALIDIFKPEAGEWFWKQYKKEIEGGVAGWWGDLGEPENHPSEIIHVNGTADEVHNIYAHYWHKMLFNNYRTEYPNTRLFNLNRAGYAGSQRYSIYPWTGDVSRSWGGLQAQLPLMLHMSLSGLPFIHSDAGGFAQGAKDDELYTRWLQMACFSPILRPHGSGIASEPVYFDENTQDIVRKFMKLRNQLHPYLYTLAAESHSLGNPIVRPMFFEFPDDSICYDLGQQYMFGDALLLAPIIVRGQQSRQVYLPENHLWYSFWDQQKYAGGQWIEVDVCLEEIPIFVKAGSYLPMVAPVNSMDDYSTQNMYFQWFVSESENQAPSIVYNDDGQTVDAVKKQAYEKMILSHDHSDKWHTIHLKREANDYQGKPESRMIQLELIGLDHEIKEITQRLNDSETIYRIRRKSGSSTSLPSYHYDDEKRSYIIDFEWKTKFVELNIKTKSKQ